MPIQFFNNGSDFVLPHPRKTNSWLKRAIIFEKRKVSYLSIIFCSDKTLLPINQNYLKHDTLTDIITFDLSVEDSVDINGEVYMSIDRIKENSILFKRPFDEEVHRVMIHGVLHLIGYNDKSPREKQIMREKEEAYLSLR
jgi:probable rRNA maturation factor